MSDWKPHAAGDKVFQQYRCLFQTVSLWRQSPTLHLRHPVPPLLVQELLLYTQSQTRTPKREAVPTHSLEFVLLLFYTAAIGVAKLAGSAASAQQSLSTPTPSARGRLSRCGMPHAPGLSPNSSCLPAQWGRRRPSSLSWALDSEGLPRALSAQCCLGLALG